MSALHTWRVPNRRSRVEITDDACTSARLTEVAVSIGAPE